MGTIIFLWIMCMIIISTVIWIVREEKETLEEADMMPSKTLQFIAFVFAPIILSIFIGGLIGLLLFFLAEQNKE